VFWVGARDGAMQRLLSVSEAAEPAAWAWDGVRPVGAAVGLVGGWCVQPVFPGVLHPSTLWWCGVCPLAPCRHKFSRMVLPVESACEGTCFGLLCVVDTHAHQEQRWRWSPAGSTVW
jgi:hypothetical protein